MICEQQITPELREEFGRNLATPPFFSIIVPVRNDQNNLRRCLESLTRLHCDSSRFEVIVVDNGSTDETRSVADSFLSGLPLRVLEKPDAYIAGVRNAGAAVARGRYLAFLDSDCEVPPDWLANASCLVDADSPSVFGCYYLIPEDSSWIARLWYDERDKKGKGKVSYLPAGDLFVSRELYQRLGGFDESIQTNEDYEFCQRAWAAGSPVFCSPTMGVIHWGTPQTLGQFFKKHRWHGMHVFRVFLRNLPALYNLKPVALAVYTLLSFAGVVIGLVLWVTEGQSWIVGAAFAAMLFPSLVLGIQGAAHSRSPSSVIRLAALYFVYATARASCLLDWHWTSRI
jgi:glycosyltransferase involved in cell wall biosynthesis